MFRRTFNLVRYRLGELLLRGTQYRVLVMVGAVVACAILGGYLVLWLDGQGFGGAAEAVWWAFLRLSDPGYLGEDQGAARRAISVVLTVAGYVLFLGAMVAIMTQWLHQTVRKLESGLTPIAARGHVVIAGWTDRSVSILREMFRAEERSRSLLGRRSGRLMAVVLAEEASPELHQNLRERMGEYWRERQIILRQGEPIYLHHLRRADFANAAAILLPGDPYQEEGDAESDVRVIKAIGSIGRHALPVAGQERPPLLVAELFDSRRKAVARSMYGGPMELVCSDRLLGGLLAQGLRYPGLMAVARDVLFAADTARVRVIPALEAAVSLTFMGLAQRLEGGALLGLVRGDQVLMCPEPGLRIDDGDELVLLAHSDAVRVGEQPAAVEDIAPAEPHGRLLSRVLVLGWTRRVPSLLLDLESQHAGDLHVEVISQVPLTDRARDLAGIHGGLPHLTQLEGDFTIPSVLTERNLAGFDAVLLVGTDRLESGSESDARSLAGLGALRSLVREAEGPSVLIELMDAENAPMVEELGAEYLVAPMVVGRVLAQVALVPDLAAAFDDLFGGGGAELVVVPRSLYAVAPDDPDAVSAAVFRAGHLPVGAVAANGALLELDEPGAMESSSLVVVYRNPQSPRRSLSGV